MTVAQLIQLLQQFPDDMAVLVEGYENGYDRIHSLSIQELAGVQNAADYDGLCSNSGLSQSSTRSLKCQFLRRGRCEAMSGLSRSESSNVRGKQSLEKL